MLAAFTQLVLCAFDAVARLLRAFLPPPRRFLGLAGFVEVAAGAIYRGLAFQLFGLLLNGSQIHAARLRLFGQIGVVAFAGVAESFAGDVAEGFHAQSGTGQIIVRGQNRLAMILRDFAGARQHLRVMRVLDALHVAVDEFVKLFTRRLLLDRRAVFDGGSQFFVGGQMLFFEMFARGLQFVVRQGVLRFVPALMFGPMFDESAFGLALRIRSFLDLLRAHGLGLLFFGAGAIMRFFNGLMFFKRLAFAFSFFNGIGFMALDGGVPVLLFVFFLLRLFLRAPFFRLMFVFFAGFDAGHSQAVEYSAGAADDRMRTVAVLFDLERLAFVVFAVRMHRDPAFAAGTGFAEVRFFLRGIFRVSVLCGHCFAQSIGETLRR